MKSERHLGMGATQASSGTPCSPTTIAKKRDWTMNERPEDVREIKLPKESEFRFELEAGAPIAVRVCSKFVPKHCPCVTVPIRS